MQQLAATQGKTLAVFAMLADKDIAGTLAACLGTSRRMVLLRVWMVLVAQTAETNRAAITR